MKLKIATGKSEYENRVTNRELAWGELLENLRKHRVLPETRNYIMTGQVPGEVRGSKHGQPIAESNLLMIDLDDKVIDSDKTWDDLLDFLDFEFPYAWAAYTTRSYTGSNVAFRVIVPFAHAVDVAHHRPAVQHILSLLPPWTKAYFDKSSESSEQPIFVPCVREEGNPHHFESGGSVLFDASTIEPEQAALVATDLDDFDALLMDAPLDLSDEQVATYLDMLDPNTLGYGTDDGTFGWSSVVAAMCHQYRGSDEGYAKLVAWSARNKEKHNERGMRSKYDSFANVGRGVRPLTFASVIAHINAQGGAPETYVEELTYKASQIESYEAYVEFRDSLRDIPNVTLGDDARAMVASELHRAYAKGAGMALTDVKKAIRPEVKRAKSTEASRPKWLKPWCYIEKDNLFMNVQTRHAINQQAFDARFMGHPEVQALEERPNIIALAYYPIPTYANTMYWPGAAVTFEHLGEKYVNTYSDATHAPRATAISEDAQRTIDMIERHFKMLVSDDRERGILMDWLAHIYQNPGSKVTWAILLQGAQGIGKSFIQVMMSLLMGENSKVLEAVALASNFNSWAHGSVLVTVEEVRIHGESGFVTLDRLKPLIANDTIQIEEKGKDRRTVPNFTNYLMLTNYKDALPIRDGERRYCVIFSDLDDEQALFDKLGGLEASQDYFEELFDRLHEHREEVAAWLGNHEVSKDFKPKGRAPDTRGGRAMKQYSQSEPEIMLDDVMDACQCAVITDDMVDITYLADMAASEGVTIPKTRTMHAILMERGLTQLPKRPYNRKTKKRHRVWHRPSKVSAERAQEVFESFYHGEGDDGDDAPF